MLLTSGILIILVQLKLLFVSKNFDENQVKIGTELENISGKKPQITQFSSHKGVHKAKVFYEESGEYCLKVSCGDKAGNQAKEFEGKGFCVDLELRKLKFPI